MALNSRNLLAVSLVGGGGGVAPITQVNTTLSNNVSMNFTASYTVSSNPSNVSPTTKNIVQTTDNGMITGMRTPLEQALPPINTLKGNKHSSNAIMYAYEAGCGLVTVQPIIKPAVMKVVHQVKFRFPDYISDSNIPAGVKRVTSIGVVDRNTVPQGSIPVPTTTYDYSFAYWKEDKTGQIYISSKTVDRDLSYTAHYTRRVYARVDLFTLNLRGDNPTEIENINFSLTTTKQIEVGNKLDFLHNYGVNYKQYGLEFLSWCYCKKIVFLPDRNGYKPVGQTNLDLSTFEIENGDHIYIFPVLKKAPAVYDDDAIKDFIEDAERDGRALIPQDLTSDFITDVSLRKTASEYTISDFDESQMVIGIAQPSGVIFDMTNIRAINPINSSDILNSVDMSEYVPNFFGISNYFERDGKYYTTKIIEDGQNLGTYYIEEFEYGLEGNGEIKNDVLNNNSKLSRRDIKNKFISAKKIFQEGYYRHRGDLVADGIFNIKEEQVYKTMAHEFLSDNHVLFYNKSLLYGSEAYHKMSLFSTGLHKMITTSQAALDEHKRISSNILDYKDLKSTTIIKQNKIRTFDFSTKENVGESIEGNILKQKRNTFQRLLDYRNFPTEKSFQDMLDSENKILSLLEYKNQSINGSNILSYYYDDDELIFGFDSRPLDKYKVFMDDITGPVAKILTNYILDGTVYQKKDIFIDDWNDNYKNKLDVMVERIYEEPDHDNVVSKLKYSTFFEDTKSNPNYHTYTDQNIIGVNSPFVKLIKNTNTSTTELYTWEVE